MSKLPAEENSEENTAAEEEKMRPDPSDFYQQRLPSWQPVMNAWPVALLFVTLGLCFLAFGIVLYVVGFNVQQYTVDYTHCKPFNNSVVFEGSSESVTFSDCADFVNDKRATDAYLSCPCSVQFTVTQLIPPPVYVYYRLTNYYQNYRKYTRSRDDYQLNGQALTTSQITSNNMCQDPFVGNSTHVYAPCGAVANSMFNDTIGLVYLSSSGNISVPLLGTNISWLSDKTVKFANPPDSYWSQTMKPPSWRVPVYQLSNDTNNNGFLNEDLIVWMRAAALPTFRKLYRRVDHSDSYFVNGLPAGTYSLEVDYAYPVISYGGSKSVVIITDSWVGHRSLYISIMYIVVGSILILISICLFIIHFKLKGKILASVFPEDDKTIENPRSSSPRFSELNR